MTDARAPRGVRLAGAWLALVAAASIWFFAGTDEVGRTARLTADAVYYHAYLPSLVLDGDLDFANQYRLTRNWYGFGETGEGRAGNVFGIGPALFELPAFLVGHAAARASGAAAHGFSRLEVAASLYMSLLASLGALVPAYRLLRRRLGGQLGPLVAPLLVAAAGPVIYYAIRQPGYAHPFATFFAAWLVERWDASFDGGGPRSLRTWSTFGLLVGATALARPQCALWAVILLAAAVDDVRRLHRARSAGDRWARAVVTQLAPRWLAGAAAALLVFAPQMLAWKALHGAYIVTPQGPGFMWWGEPAWSEVLFSSRNGLLPWAPLYALAAAGLIAAAVRAPRLGIALLAGVGLQIWANGAVWDWWAGGSFGGRRFDSAFIAFAAGLGALLAWPRIWRERSLRARAAQAGVAAAVLAAALLAAANLVFASRRSAATVPVFGGRPASRVLAAAAPSPLGPIAGAASSLANLPARLAFAWCHGTSLDAYDRVVGVHQLGELYPGLNRTSGATHATMAFDRADTGTTIGLRAGRRQGTAELVGSSAHILVALNRRDPIALSLRAAAPSAPPAAIELWLDGELLARGQLAAEPTLIACPPAPMRRGINVVEIRAAPGTALYALELRGTANPAGE